MQETPFPPVETFAAKRLLSPVKPGEAGWFAADHNMNLYRGCNHGCIYCDTRSECYRIDRFETVRYKENCLSMLETELRQKKKPGIVSIGAASDPYNALEAQLLITRQSLLLLKRYRFGVGMSTKSDLIARDADVLAEMGAIAPVRTAFSITAAEDELSLLLEPGAPATSARFAALKVLANAGVFAGVWVNPMLPFLTDSRENLIALLRATAKNGGRYAVCHFGMTLRTGNREYFFAALDKIPRFKGIKQQYSNAFGLSYACPSPQADALYALFKEECHRLGLLWSFSAINQAAKEACPQQISMF